MHLQENTLFAQNVAQYPPHHVTYVPVLFADATSNSLGGYAFTRKYIIWSWSLGQGHTTIAQHSLNHAANAPAKFGVAASNSLGIDAFTRKYIFFTFHVDLEVNVIRNVGHYPLHHVTYAPANFEVATFNALDGDAFTRKYKIWPFTLTLRSKTHETSPITLYIMWSMHLQSLKLLGPTISERVQWQETWRTDRRTDGRTTDRLWYSHGWMCSNKPHYWYCYSFM